jgi:hypothetical protein
MVRNRNGVQACPGRRNAFDVRPTDNLASSDGALQPSFRADEAALEPEWDIQVGRCGLAGFSCRSSPQSSGAVLPVRDLEECLGVLSKRGA